MENILHQPLPPATKRPRLSLSTTINNLPDNIVTHILSFLPLKYAFRTIVLSKRWVPLSHSL
ncbi:F-box protein [Medicago truncatula]|uniref:F-box protein n=1 Tax=Medicago truncatula TaxID=3880 RepID=G7K038_MEDTR|nr:F-box protein [Medicago truncatula]